MEYLTGNTAILLCAFISMSIFVLTAIKILSTPYGKYEERYLKGASGQLNRMFIFLPPEAILYLKFLGLFLGAAIMILLFNNVKFKIVQYVLTTIGGVMGFYTPDMILKFMWQKRLEKFENQLLEGLNSMANSLKAGFSFPQALEQLAKESAAPFSQEMNLVLKE
ncbi:MAG: hypothetical protein ACD_79C01234G0010, partial [uncultured bacterium]